MQAIFPGTFDPATRGHLDLIERASRVCERLVVAVNVGESHNKKPLFSADERLNLLYAEIKHIVNVEIAEFAGLLVDFANAVQITTIIRGVRNSSDWEYETQLAYMNHELQPQLEVIFLATRPEYSFIRASWIREIAALGGDVSAFVTPKIAAALKQKM